MFLVPFEGAKPPPDPMAPVELRFQSARLGFKPDSAQFRDPENARAIIYDSVQEILDHLNANDGKNLYVVGSIARTGPNVYHDTAPLCDSRAQAVKDILVEFGIPGSRLVIINAGTFSYPPRDKDEFPGGIKNPANMENNRVVVVISEGTPAYEKLIMGGYIR